MVFLSSALFILFILVNSEMVRDTDIHSAPWLRPMLNCQYCIWLFGV